MSAPVYVEDGCIGCEQCITACPFGAIDMVDGVAVINEACRACGECVPACPVSVIVMTTSEAKVLEGEGVMVY
ncbi:4Fe-4S binding protein, partial [Candidatus Bathyarchaeota archaeon]|nr:4Fe-4S binding protein [Candidatus Bathyarchaeota archaeon]